MPNKERQKKALKDWIKAEGGYQPEPLIGDHEQVTPPNTGSNVKPNTLFSCPVKVPKKADSTAGYVNTCVVCGLKYVDSEQKMFPICPKCAKERHDDSILPQLNAQLYAQAMENPYGDLPPTQQKIHQIMNAMKDLLLYKNQKYGDSAINPKGIFYKGDSTNSILIRLDDKIGRVMSNTEEKPRVNDVCDIIGYCTLLLISMGVTAEDIAKFKD